MIGNAPYIREILRLPLVAQDDSQTESYLFFLMISSAMAR